MGGTVRSVTYFGSMQRVMVETDEAGELEVDVDNWRNPTPLSAGQNVDLMWEDHAAVLLQRPENERQSIQALGTQCIT